MSESKSKSLVTEPQPLCALANPDAKVNLIIVYNPLNVSERFHHELVWGHKRSLADYLIGLPEEVHWGVCVNAEPVDEEHWADTYLNPDDYLTIMPLPAGGGGGGGKGVMRIVAMIAIAVVAWYAAPYLAGTAMGIEGAAAGMTAAELAAGTAFTATQTGIGIAIASGVISGVGGMLVNALMPAPKPKTPDESWNSVAGGTNSPSYGIDGPKNTATEDVPVPVCYGTYRMGGNLVNMRTENDGDTQWLYMQSVLSEGEIESISDIMLNDQPIAQFNNVEVQTRLGTDNQAIVPWFDDTAAAYSKGVKLTKDNWVTHTTLSEVDKLRIDLVFPAGLAGTNASDGSRVNATVDVEIQYRKVGTTDWNSVLGEHSWQSFSSQSPSTATAIEVTLSAGGGGETTAAYRDYSLAAEYRKVGSATWLPLGSESGSTANEFVREWNWSGDSPTFQERYVVSSVSRTFRVENLEQGAYEVRVTSGSLSSARAYAGTPISITASTRSALRRSYFTPTLEEGKYEVRARRTTDTSTQDLLQDTVNLADVWEIFNEDVCYNHTAYLALKIKLTDQLNGVPKITALVKGRKLPYYDRKGNLLGTRFSATPAWIALDIMAHERYGGGMDLSRVDFSALVDLAEYNESKGLLFNGVFDFNTNVWEAVQNVLRVGHSQIINVGTRYSFAIEKPDEPAMMFSVANIIEDTFSIEWLPVEDRANDIEVNFYDEADGYRRRSIKVYDQEALDRGAKVRSASIALLGVTNAGQALAEGWLQLALNRYILQTVSFEAPLEAIACTVGSLVFVQHDMPQWGYGGKLEASSTTTTLQLDRPVTMTTGKVYKTLVHFDALKRYEGTIQSIIGASLFVSGIADSAPKRCRRIITGGRDLRVLSVVPSAPYKEIIVESVADLEPGMTFELWDTDVLEERQVVTEPGETMTITLQAPLSGAPGQFANWMFGENMKIKKPFRVIAIGGAGEITRQLKCLEYNESVYSDPENAAATPNYSDISATIGHVTINGAYEDLFRSGTAVRTRLIVEWTPPSGVYDGAAIYVSVNNSAYENTRTIRGGGTSYSQEFNDGDLVKIKIVAIDGAGGRATFNDAPEIQRVIVGKSAPPANVTNFKVAKAYGGLSFTWDNVPDVDVIGYEIRQGASWDSGVKVIENYAGNSLVIAEAASGVFTWHIRAIDSTGHYSETPATFTMQVVAPAAVRGFDVVQNQNIIQFVWQANAEPDLSGYEIREGASWGSGVVIGTNLMGTRFSIPSNIPADRQFWIKAIDRSKVQSTRAAGALARFVPVENHNVILERDEKARGWDGHKINVSVMSGSLVLDAGKTYGEYLHEMSLSESAYARNVISVSMDAILQSNETWAQASYTWGSTAAKRKWLMDGNIDSVSLEQQIAVERSLLPSELDGIALNNSVTSISGVVADEAIHANTWQAGRFLSGLNITDMTSVSWPISVPSTFNLRLWLRVTGAVSKARFVTLKATDGAWLALDHDGGVFKLVGSDGSQVATTGLSYAPGDLLLVSIVQTAGTRRVHIGRPSDGAMTTGSSTLAPLGAWSRFALY